MTTKRKTYSTQTKLRVALEAYKGDKTRNEIASSYKVHPGQVTDWKTQLLASGDAVFGRKQDRGAEAQAAKEAELYEQIGRLKVELEWVKKKLPNSVEIKRQLVEAAHSQISVRRQCELIGLNRATYYYEPARENELNLVLMRSIDEQYLQTPFYGYRRMTQMLRRLGLAEAKWRALTGEPFTGREAADIGLINKAIPFDQLESTVAEVAAKLKTIPWSQLATQKMMVNHAYEQMGIGAVQTLGPIMDGIMRNTPDALKWIEKAEQEGVRQAITERDGPFGDYSQAPKERRPNPNNIIHV